MAKKGQVSIYEAQKAGKPAIEDVCEQILTDPVLREGMTGLLALSREIHMKPCWFVTNTWKCSYKGKRVVTYGVGRGDRMETNYLKISVFFSDVDKSDLDAFFEAQSEEMRTECISGMKCRGCGGCKPGIKQNILGRQYMICWKACYERHNPTLEQFQWIEKMILARREYIKTKQYPIRTP